MVNDHRAANLKRQLGSQQRDRSPPHITARGVLPGRYNVPPNTIDGRRYCAAILLHCASASCLSDAIGIFAAAVRQACFALLSALFTFALLVVI